MLKRTIDLCGAWKFRQVSAKKWSAATVPGCVHTDLRANNLIPDPFWGSNELLLDWIERTDWEYQKTFSVSGRLLAEARVELVSEGLDTLATIFINGREVGRTDNMFVGYRFPVKPFLRPGSNTIRIRFSNPMAYIEQRSGLCGFQQPNDPVGGCSLIRKEQCSFGWDWGPRLPTSGIYLPIRLEACSGPHIYGVRVQQVHTDATVWLTCMPEVRGEPDTAHSWRIGLALDGRPVAEADGLELQVRSPRLWWPNGMGGQPLYDLTVQMVHNGSVVDTWTHRIGLRTVVLDRHPDEWGESFQFVVNGVPCYAKGACWVPCHSFQSEVTREQYENLLTSAAQANMNMIRVWGGGVYEGDSFYDLCDEKGLLVWHDFMFACSPYPGDEPFVASVKEEVEHQIRRLRNHASLALWCGNNEMEQQWVFRHMLQSPERLEDYEKVFLRMMPEAIQQLSPQIPYWPSSPHNPENYREKTENPRAGDAHYWGIWHGRERAEVYEERHFRFWSEFGMQAFPGLETVRTFTEEKTLNVYSPDFENHQKCPSGNSLIADYVAQRFRFPKDSASLIYLSQVNQIHCIKVAAEHQRRSMPRSMGSLFWQLNDCWPVASWSSIDFGGQWKGLQYAARRFYAPALVSAKLVGTFGVGRLNRQLNTVTGVEIHTVFDGMEACSATIHWTLYHLDGRIIRQEASKATLEPRTSVLRQTLDMTDDFRKHGRNTLYLHLFLTGESSILSQTTVLFSIPKHVEFPRERLSPLVKKLDDRHYKLVFRAKTFQHYVSFHLAGLRYRASDNFFDLYPGIPHALTVELEKPCEMAEVRKKLAVMSLADSY